MSRINRVEILSRKLTTHLTQLIKLSQHLPSRQKICNWLSLWYITSKYQQLASNSTAPITQLSKLKRYSLPNSFLPCFKRQTNTNPRHITMKLSLSPIFSTLTLLTPALGCVQAWGLTSEDDFVDLAVNAALTDNRGEVCSTAVYGGWRIDQDNHISVNCVSGYVWAFTQNSETSWYGYPGSAFSWSQNVDVWADDCNPPQEEWCYYWQ
jgi:hypothetical protein